MASFKVPCNWDIRLLDVLEGVKVADIFGMLPAHVAGGGRPSAALPNVNEQGAAAFIAAAKAKGYAFNYLFNAPCMDANEFTGVWREKFLAHLDWVVESGAVAVTLAVPYLIEVVKKRYPGLRICVSSFARVNSVRRAIYFKELGADEITPDPVSTTRDFAVLEAMASRSGCMITPIANGLCLYQCPFAQYHMVLTGHSSQEGHPSTGRHAEYPFFNCTLRMLRDPSEIIRGAFIRPQDIKVYEEIGIHCFKLVDRARPTEWLARVIEAYAAGQYEGDLLEILNFPHFLLEILYRQSGMDGMPAFPRVDTRALDGFIDKVRAVDCDSAGCDACRICDEYARIAVTVPDGVERVSGMVDHVLKGLNFG